jgi:hypothetical protein
MKQDPLVLNMNGIDSLIDQEVTGSLLSELTGRLFVARPPSARNMPGSSTRMAVQQLQPDLIPLTYDFHLDGSAQRRNGQANLSQ